MSIHHALRPSPHLRVLVTAGAGGIGAAVARAFHAAGAHVHVCDVDRAALDRLTAETRGITGSMADVSVVADADAVFDDVNSALGGLDVLINGAGIAGPAGPIEGISAAGWERTVAVNLGSQYHFAHRAVPLLRQSCRGSSLIAVAADAGRTGGAQCTPCVATRWALVGLVKSLAMELGPHGIRVNAILPGMGKGGRLAVTERHAAVTEGRGQATHARHALRRRARAEDVAAMALFLCSPAARHVTGQAIGLNDPPDHG